MHQNRSRLALWELPSALPLAVGPLADVFSTNCLNLEIGSDDQAKIYLNVELIYKHEIPRSFVPDESAVEEIGLHEGLNVIVFKVVNEIGDWKGSVRFADKDGNAVKGLTVSLTSP